MGPTLPSPCDSGAPLRDRYLRMPVADVAALQAAPTPGTRRRSSAAPGGGASQGDNVARGVVTVDTVNSCNTDLPTSPAYFTAIATFQNVPLRRGTGSSTADADNNFAHGDSLVAIEASLTESADGRRRGTTRSTAGSPTSNGSGADHREALPTVWMAGTSTAARSTPATDGVRLGATGLAPRGASDYAPLPHCRPDPGQPHRVRRAGSRRTTSDQRELPAAGHRGRQARRPVTDPLENAFGFLYYDLQSSTPPYRPSGRRGSRTSPTLVLRRERAASKCLHGLAARQRLGAVGCTYFDVPECSNGSDDDRATTTFIDFPARPRMPGTAPGNRGAAPCQRPRRRTNNRLVDTARDYPADPGCQAAWYWRRGPAVAATYVRIEHDGDTFIRPTTRTTRSAPRRGTSSEWY